MANGLSSRDKGGQFHKRESGLKQKRQAHNRENGLNQKDKKGHTHNKKNSLKQKGQRRADPQKGG